MRQQDFGRPLVLPGLDDVASLLRRLTYGEKTPTKHRMSRIVGALEKAAEDGFLSWSCWHGEPPAEWLAWCQENHHPPVLRINKVDYAAIDCDLSTLDCRWLKGQERTELYELMSTFNSQPSGRKMAAGSVVSFTGVLIEDSREAAIVLTDYLVEHLEWKS